MPYNTGQMPPGGAHIPWNATPPNNSPGGQGAYFNPISLIPGQLPSDGGGGGGGSGGDTQVGYPEAPPAPLAPTYTFISGTPLLVSYIESGASTTSVSEGHGLPPIRVYLGANAAGATVAGSLRFTFRGRTYVDRGGSLYYAIDPTTNTGTLGGSYDYIDNVATLTDYATGSNTVTIISMATRYTEIGVDGVMFRTTGNPLRIGSFTLRATTMDGTELTATADVNGDIVASNIKGHVDWPTGLTRIAFGALVTAAGNESQPWYNPDLIDGSGKIWRPTQVDPASIFFGTVVYRSIPVDPALVGIDPVRLPSDGRVLGFNPGTPAILSHTQVTSISSPTAGATVNLGRIRIGYIDVYDSSDPVKPVEDVWYTIDLDAGTLTWSDPLNLSAYTLPIVIRDRIQDTALISDVQITGEVSLGSPVTHNYPAGAVLSNALAYGDMQARVSDLFDQQTYQAGVWLDVLSGSPAGATYNDVVYPLVLTNDAGIDERWAVVFTSPTAVNVIGETTGQIAQVSITDDIAPVNPVTVTTGEPDGKPYFLIHKEGWGTGWQAGNVLRFNTISATKPTWAARVTLPGEITVDDDAVRIQVYGNGA